MSTTPVKTKTLHNFSLPCLKWAHKNSTPRHRTRLSVSPHNPSSQPDHDPTQNHHDGPEESSAKPWNLRPRKAQTAACEANEPPSAAAPESERGGAQKSERREKKTKLWITLSREEIEEDLYSMNGSKPARRPKKRTKIIQKQVDVVFPGLYLAGATADSFRVQFTS